MAGMHCKEKDIVLKVYKLKIPSNFINEIQQDTSGCDKAIFDTYQKNW